MFKHIKQNSNFRLLWVAQIISGTGDVLCAVGIMVYVYHLTGSALQTVMVMAAKTLPTFFISPIAGAIVDKYKRKQVMLSMDIIRAILIISLLYFIYATNLQLVGIYAIVIGLSIANAFYKPAKMAIIPSLVETANLGKANGLLIGTGQAITAIGFGLGGLLTLWLGFEVFIIFNAVTFIAAAMVTFYIKTPYLKLSQRNIPQPLLQSIKGGYSDLKKHKVAYPLVILEILEYFPHGIWTAAILLAFVEKSLNGTTDDWGMVLFAYFIGMFLGAMLSTYAHKIIHQRTGLIIVINIFLTSLLTIAFGMSSTILLVIVICVAFGLPNSIRDVAQDTLLQSSVPQDLLGRVYAFRSMFTSITVLAAGFVFAWIADFTDVRYIYIIGGILYLMTAFYALGNKALRESYVEG